MTTGPSTAAIESAGFRVTLRHICFVILIAAICVSSYLSYLKASGTNAVCVESSTFDCGTVLNSAYSEISGIPISWLGLATNIIVLTLLLVEPRLGFTRQFGPTLVMGPVLFAFLFSMYLIYVQSQLIKAYCPWCLCHEVLISVLFILTAFRLRNHLRQPLYGASQVHYVEG
jgi:uncharacterized membrane protein